MRICEINGEQVELTTRNWIKKKCPKVIGCSDLKQQKPCPRIDWSISVPRLATMLEREERRMRELSEYIVEKSRLTRHHWNSYSINSMLVSELLDWAFDCGWTGELDKIQEDGSTIEQEQVESVEEKEELDAPTDLDVDLNKLKFIKDDTSTIKRSDSQSELDEGGEGRASFQDSDRESRGSNEEVATQTRSKKVRGKRKR